MKLSMIQQLDYAFPPEHCETDNWIASGLPFIYLLSSLSEYHFTTVRMQLAADSGRTLAQMVARRIEYAVRNGKSLDKLAIY